MQVVCDNYLKKRDVFIGYPGSVHDSRVLRTSPLFEDMPNKCADKYLLGDSGHPCLRHLITAYPDRGQLGRKYLIQNTLYHIKLRKIPDIVHFIRACCVLHNLAICDNFDEGNVCVNEIFANVGNYIEEAKEKVIHDREGIEYRDFLVRNVIVL
ncbi:dde superfamily endonuclease [Holotrichia oblita]|uniref:Dde superfamily endonuclease n=1 Tax=Holotrichia oblita TaxID=644536 RepID=A0ACB9SK64_HOLOL|nr:dde superfamily endonuclease [Holotrichia oblita]